MCRDRLANTPTLRRSARAWLRVLPEACGHSQISFRVPRRSFDAFGNRAWVQFKGFHDDRSPLRRCGDGLLSTGSVLPFPSRSRPGAAELHQPTVVTQQPGCGRRRLWLGSTRPPVAVRGRPRCARQFAEALIFPRPRHHRRPQCAARRSPNYLTRELSRPA